MSSTDGLNGYGVYDEDKKYSLYLRDILCNLKNLYKKKNSNLLKNGFPQIWTLEFLKIHNCVICSSVVIEKTILDKINNFKNMKPPGEDYDCWLRVLEHTDNFFVDDICFYYDSNHGDGRNY